MLRMLQTDALAWIGSGHGFPGDEEHTRRLTAFRWRPLHETTIVPVNPNHINRRLQKQIIFAFTFIFAVLLFFRNEEPTRLQVIYRVMMMAVGIGGFIYVSKQPRE